MPRKQLNTSQDRYQQFYNSKEWRSLRDAFVKRNRYSFCYWCGKGFGPKEWVHVDHVEPIRERWDLRLTPTNLRVMHRGCHTSHTKSKKVPIRADGTPADGSWD